jgi:hypothetical protein
MSNIKKDFWYSTSKPYIKPLLNNNDVSPLEYQKVYLKNWGAYGSP